MNERTCERDERLQKYKRSGITSATSNMDGCKIWDLAASHVTMFRLEISRREEKNI